MSQFRDPTKTAREQIDAATKRRHEAHEPSVPPDVDRTPFPPPVSVGVGSRPANGGYPSAHEIAGKVSHFGGAATVIFSILASVVGTFVYVTIWMHDRPSRAEMVQGDALVSARVAAEEKEREELARQFAKFGASLDDIKQSVTDVKTDVRGLYQTGLANHVYGPEHPAPPSLAAPRGPR